MLKFLGVIIVMALIILIVCGIILAIKFTVLTFKNMDKNMDKRLD